MFSLAPGPAAWQLGVKLGWAVLLGFAGLPPGRSAVWHRGHSSGDWLALAGVPQAAGPYGLITLQGSLGLFLGGSASQNNTRKAPVREHQLEKVPLAKKRPETNPDSRGGGIGSVSLGEEGELQACFEVAHTTASDGRHVRRDQAWGGRSTEACGQVALC